MYHHDFQRWDVRDARPAQVSRPTEEWATGAGERFSGNTEAHDAYPAYPAQPHTRRAPPPNGTTPQEPTRFEGRTVAQDDYSAPPREALRQMAIAPPASRGTQAVAQLPFEGSTEAHDAYKHWNVEPRSHAPMRAPRDDLPTSSLPFEGRTTAQDDFVAPPQGTTSPMRMRAPGSGGAADSDPVRFEGRTVAQDDYCAPPASARRQEPVAARHSGSHTLSSAPFEGSSEARDAYRAHSVQPRSSPLRAPHGDLPTASLPFEGRTTAQDDFVAPPPVPVQPLRAPGNGAPRARGKGGAHAPPADTSFAPSGRFEGASESREAYKRYDPSEAPRRQPIRPAATDPRSSTKFEGQATSRADYLPPPADALVVRMQTCLPLAYFPRPLSDLMVCWLRSATVVRPQRPNRRPPHPSVGTAKPRTRTQRMCVHEYSGCGG